MRLLQFLWMMFAWDPTSLPGFKKRPEPISGRSPAHRALGFIAIAAVQLFRWSSLQKGTERVQTLLGIYVSMVGPTGFEPVTKRL